MAESDDKPDSKHDDKSIYEALVIPEEALHRGGVEILRAGLMSDELYVAARPAFDDPALWGEVLADITRRIARLYEAEGKFTHRQALGTIESAFAAELGAPAISPRRRNTRLGKRGAKRRVKASAKRRPKARAKARKATRRKGR